MGSVVIDMSMSLDGYIAAPNDNPEQGLGEDGMRLHNWAFEDPSVAERVYADLAEETGAVIMGRRSYDNSIQAWGGKGPLGEVPCLVVTHRPPADSDPVFTFVTDGIEAALATAQEVAAGKRIGLMGANIDQQFLAAGLVDEIRIHLINVLLGGGRRLFDQLPERVELEQTGLSQTNGDPSRVPRRPLALPASSAPAQVGGGDHLPDPGGLRAAHHPTRSVAAPVARGQQRACTGPPT